jgi:2-C-methyl-D-erythritol 4-phosphate cytidylyltransferase
MNIAVIIPAAGKGKRMQAGLNKQYLYLGNKPVLYHTLKAFDEIKGFSEIVLVVGEEEFDLCQREIMDRFSFQNKVRLVAGGAERQDSVRNGLLSLKQDTDLVLIHDGARPLVTKELIQNAIAVGRKEEACILAVPVKDTIKVLDETGYIKETPERHYVWAAQTPQVFSYDLILKAHLKAKEEGFVGTDDSMLVERLGRSVKTVLGSYDNIKITTPHDLITAEQILRRR